MNSPMSKGKTCVTCALRIFKDAVLGFAVVKCPGEKHHLTRQRSTYNALQRQTELPQQAHSAIKKAFEKVLEHPGPADDMFDGLIGSLETCPYCIDCDPPVCLWRHGGCECRPFGSDCRLWGNIKHLHKLLHKCVAAVRKFDGDVFDDLDGPSVPDACDGCPYFLDCMDSMNGCMPGYESCQVYGS